MSNLHLVKYAKGHYGKSDYLYSDLSSLIKKWSGWHPECINDNDLLHCVYSVWNELATCPTSIILDLFHNEKIATRETTIKTMLQHLRWIKVDLPENYPDIFFGDENDLKRIKKQLPSCFGAGI